MSNSLLIRKVFIWAHSKRGVNSRGWPGRASKVFTNIRLPDLLDFEMCSSKDLVAVNDTAFKTFKNEWSAKINRFQARYGHGSNINYVCIECLNLSMVWSRMSCL